MESQYRCAAELEASQRPQIGLLDTYKTVNGTRTDRIDQINCDVHEEDGEDEGQHRGGGWQEALDATAQARGACKNADRKSVV